MGDGCNLWHFCVPAADTGSNVCPWLDSGRFQECQKYPRNPSSRPFLAVVCIQQGSRNPKGYPVGLGCNLCHAAVLPHSPVKWKEGQSPESPPPVRTGHVSCPDFSTIDLSPSTFLCLSCILSPSQMSSTLGRGACLSIEEGSFLSTPPSETLGKPQELLHPQQAPALHNSALKRLRPTGTSPSSPPAGRRGAVPQQ